MTEIAVLVGEKSGKPDKTRYAGTTRIGPYDPTGRIHDSHLDYMGYGVKQAIKDSLRFDHNIAKVTEGAIAYQLGHEHTYAWSEITTSAPDDEYTAGSDWDWDSGFPHPESARISDTTRRYMAFVVNAQKMPNRHYFLGEQISTSPARALRTLVERSHHGPDACRNETHYAIVYDFTHRAVTSWDHVGFPRDDVDPEEEHDGTDFLRQLPHRSLEEVGKEIEVQDGVDDDGNPQPILTTTEIEE